MLTLIVVLTRSASVGYEPFAVNLLVDVVLTSRLVILEGFVELFGVRLGI